MKKALSLICILGIVSFTSICFLTGCTASLSKEQKYLLDGTNISFTLSNIWEKELNTEHDLSLTKLNANLQLSVYKRSETGVSADELLSEKIKEELEDSDSKTLVKKYNINRTRNRTIHSKLYSATKDNIETEYLFSVIEFDNSDTYVFVVYTAKGAYMQYSIDDIQRLLIKMEWNGSKTELVYN